VEEQKTLKSLSDLKEMYLFLGFTFENPFSDTKGGCCKCATRFKMFFPLDAFFNTVGTGGVTLLKIMSRI